MKSAMVKKILSVVVAGMFLFQNAAFALEDAWALRATALGERQNQLGITAAPAADPLHGVHRVSDLRYALSMDVTEVEEAGQRDYGEAWPSRKQRLIDALDKFAKDFPGVSHVAIGRAPGRVTANEHTDYNDAESMGIPTLQDNIVIVGIDPSSRKLVLKNMDPAKYHNRTMDITAVETAIVEAKASKAELDPLEQTIQTIKGLLALLRQNYGLKDIPGLCIVVDGRESAGGVPAGSNMSSSAANEEALIYGIEAALGLEGKITGGEAVQIGRGAEAAIGFPCGALDQGSSTGLRLRVRPGQRAGVVIDCVPRVDPQGRTVIEGRTFEVPALLEAVLVDTGPKENEQREYNIRVTEGELGACILAQHIDKLRPDASEKIKQNLGAAAAQYYSGIDRTHNGKPYLYNDGNYPIFFKPAFFSRTFLKRLGIEVSEEELNNWIARTLPNNATKEELINTYGVPAEFFEKSAALARNIDIPVDTHGFNLRGTCLHAAGDQDRVELIEAALAKVNNAKNPQEAEAALNEFGRLQHQGYKSLRDNYRNSTRRIDEIATWAATQPWCLGVGSEKGARHFGAGFGGWMEIWIKPGMYEEAATAIRERFGDIPMKPFKAGTPASVMFKGNAGKAIATLYFNELDNESQDILNAMNPYPQVQNILAGVMLGRLTPEQAVAAIVNLKLPSEYTAEDAATLVEKTQAAMVVAPEPAKEPYLAGLPTAQQAAEHADKLGMLARRSRIEQSLNNLAEGQLAGLLTSLQSETQTPYMPQTAIEPIKQILIMARRGLITRAETINMLIAQSSESYSISEDLAEYWVDQAIDPEVASDLKANANPREAHKVAMVGITVIDLILNRKWDQIPEWLREKLIKNSLVVEGDIPGTVDKKGGLIERFLREELTAEERDQLSNELILGGPACSASRVFGQVTKDGNSRAALFSSVSPDGTTIGLLKPDLDSAGVKTNTDGVMMSFKNPTAKTLIFEMGEGARSFLHNIGASANLTIEAFRQAVEEGQFDKMEIIEFGGVELSALMDHLDEAIAALRAREKKIGKHFVIMLDTVVDPAHKWKKFKINNYAVFREIDVFLTNMDEGGQIFGDAISDNKDKAEEHKRICTYQELLEFFGSKGAKAVFLKMGGLGSVVMTTKDSVFGKHEYRHIPVLAGLKKVSGTGTGDAFSAGAAYAKAYGWDTVKAALFATALGGLCLEHRGGTLGPKNDFRTARFKMQELTAQPEVEASLKGELSVDKSVQVSTILEQLSVVSHPILLPGELLSELTRPGKVYATVVDALEYRGDKKKIAEIADAVQKVEEVINAFNRFQGLFKVTSGNCTVELITAGRVNLANYLLILDTGEKFIVQQPNPVFGFEAMNSNLKTFLDTAQPAAMADAKRDNGKFPRTWQAVDYLRTDNGNILFYTNPQEPNKGAAWRVMKFVDGKVFNSLEEAAQCAEAEYREKKKEQNQPVDEQEMEAYKKKYIEDIVRSMGEAMVDFRWMLEQANIEGESLPNFHNTARYAGQVEALANGGTAVVNPSCLKDGAPKTKMAEGLMGSPYAGRVKYMLAEFEKRTDLAHALDGAGEAGQHGDTKINNFMFDPKTRKVICLIDLDTMQKGRAVDDFGDAGRLIINLSGEDPRDEKGQRDINRVSVSIGLLKVMTEAYLARIEHYYGAEERKRLGPYLHQSVRVFLHELSMRFFTSFFTELVEPDPTIDSNNPIEVRKRTHGTYFGLREGEDPDKNLWAAEVQARTLQEYEKALAQKGLLKTEFAREPVVSPAAPAQMVLPHPQPALSAV